MKKPKLNLIKKAWDIADLNSWKNNWYTNKWEYAETVYAETRGGAKLQCSDYEKFTDIQVRRNKSRDIVEYEGREYKRGNILYDLSERERREKRIEKLKALPDNELFYVQYANGYVGNSVKWWGKNSCGYPIDIDQAEKFTKEEIIKKFSNGRTEDVIWIASHVDSKIRKHVDSQYLEYEYSVK